jgi:hypothetical protein
MDWEGWKPWEPPEEQMKRESGYRSVIPPRPVSLTNRKTWRQADEPLVRPDVANYLTDWFNKE